MNTNLGVRSVSFMDGVLTVGTGQGALMFFDLRAGHFIESDIDGKTVPVKLYTGKGYLVSYFLELIHVYVLVKLESNPNHCKLI